MPTQYTEQQASMTDRVQDSLHIPEEQRAPLWRGLIAGLVIGILIGWFVLGWWLFPVSYEGAYAHHLNDEAQADYLSAVADAYAARRDAAALALAQYRLRAFIGEDILADSIQGAQDHIFKLQSSMPPDAALTRDVLESTVRIDNLNLLASTIIPQPKAPVEAAAEQEPSANATEVVAEPDPTASASQPSDPTQTANGDDGGSPWQWLLGGFFAVMLIGGGIFILRGLTKGRDKGNGDAARGKSGDNQDEDPDNVSGSPGYTVTDHTTTAGSPAGGAPIDRPTHILAPTLDPDQYADYSFPSDDEEADGQGMAPGAFPASSQVEFDESDWPKSLDPAEASPAAVAEQPTPMGRTQAMRGAVIATNTAQFNIGVTDYDQAFALIDPDTSINIGDCGVGVTMPGGMRDNHPEEVISLDVWLFDKADEERIGNYKRVLISEYVVDQGIEPNFEGIQGAVGDPIVAQSGTEFKIEGENLKLLCRVIEAEYSESSATKGIFTNVKVELSVLKQR